MFIKQRIIVLFIGIAYAASSFGQTKESLKPTFLTPRNTLINPIKTVIINADKSLESLTSKLSASVPKIGYCIPTDINLLQEATQIKEADKTIFLFQLIAPKAKGLVPYFDQFLLTGDATLHIYSPNHTEIIGAFTAENSASEGFYCTGLILSDTLIFEYTTSNLQAKDKLHLNEIGYAYKELGVRKASREFGDAESCEVNINCSEGTKWQNQKKAVVRILVKTGQDFGWCSGTLINNTAQDCTPYILTADHCGIASNGNYATNTDFSQWVYYFNYESPDCSNPSIEGILGNQFLTGSSRVAYSNDNGGDNGSDFLLTKLTLSPPLVYNAYYAGWNRANSAPDSGVCIHHPNADIKKISTSRNKPTIGTWGGITANTHLSIKWSSTSNGWGITEEGSSGSSFFNPSGQIVGTLTGGASFCTSPTDIDGYGRFYYHWDKNGTNSNRKLQPWLDPNNTNAISIDGRSACGGVGIIDFGKSDELFTVYPNPSHGQITIHTKQVDKLLLYSIEGKLLYEWESITNDLRLENLAKGTYLLKAISQSNSWSSKFVVQ